MKILAVHTGHDASLALYDDYERLFIAKEERLNRIKCYSGYPALCFDKLRAEHDLAEVDRLVLTRTGLDRRFYTIERTFKRLERDIKERVNFTPAKSRWLQVTDKSRIDR